MARRHHDPHDAMPGIRRRQFLGTTLLAPFGASLALLLDGKRAHAQAFPPCQGRWAHCVNCNLFYFDGYTDNGRCPAHGTPSTQPHVAEKRAGSVKPYYIAYDDSTGPGQGDWRYCRKCKVLFFNGYPQKGLCPRDGQGHEAAGYNFFLYHDRTARVHEEAGWRFCVRCQALFQARANRSGCPADGKAHQAAGYLFLVGLTGGCFDDCPKAECR